MKLHSEMVMALELLGAVTVVALVARRFGFPYGTALVAMGLVLGVTDLVPKVALDAELMLGLFLPILLFDAAISTNSTHLHKDRVSVGLLSTAGVFVSAGISALLIAWALKLPWALALLMGVMFSITDTVAILAVFRSLKVPHRLATIVEGESLFNDGVTLVLFKLVLGIVLTSAFNPAATAFDLVLVSAGGGVVGFLAGMLTSAVLRHAPDHLSEIVTTVLLAIGTYHLAEGVHVSGVIAVVVAGLVVGNYAWRRALEPSSQIAMVSFWEFAAFGVNSLVFLLVGLNIPLQALQTHADKIGWCLVAIVLGRMAAIYGGFPTLRFLRSRPVPLSWQHVMVWGNIKGSLTMVLALSLPAQLPQRELIVTVTFGVVLVSLVLQGMSLGRVIRGLNIAGVSDLQREFEQHQLALIRARAAQKEMTALVEAGVLSRSSYERMKSRYQVIIAQAERALRHLCAVHQTHIDAALAGIRHRVLQVEKAAVLQAVRDGLVSDQIGSEAIVELNRDLVITGHAGPSPEQENLNLSTDGGGFQDSTNEAKAPLP
ncbi:MAG: sodium:proton antiporter [Candidatus Sericytochromatia bacterium]|nr:sodium:proton antiporter [Candidatus Sericytochromatia bacterium]